MKNLLAVSNPYVLMVASTQVAPNGTSINLLSIWPEHKRTCKKVDNNKAVKGRTCNIYLEMILRNKMKVLFVSFGFSA